MKNHKLRNAAGVIAALHLATTVARPADRFETLMHFNGGNGARPTGALVQALDGNFYGTTGGVGGKPHLKALLFRLTPEGVHTTVHNLPLYSAGGLVQATDGNLYGTTGQGGATGLGTVFRIALDGTLTTLYSFCADLSTGCKDGTQPAAGLIQASDGNFYGTTGSDGANGAGTVFEITPAGALTTLYSFCGQTDCADGSISVAPLLQGNDGNFYGTTLFGGNTSVANTPCPLPSGCGTIFRITPTGQFTTLYKFCGQANCPDSAYPEGALIQAKDGNFYGTTSGATSAADLGSAFKITPAGELTTLYHFCSQPACMDGESPAAGMVQATDGNFYGTTLGGGVHRVGVIFKMTPSGTVTVLHSFGAGPDYKTGYQPDAPLIQATDGSLYGTTHGYEYPNMGTAFRFSAGLREFVSAIPASAAPGATVTILGTNLTGASSVSFHKTPATSFTVNSTGSAITATVPAGATTGPIWVKTSTRTVKSNVSFRVSN